MNINSLPYLNDDHVFPVQRFSEGLNDGRNFIRLKAKSLL